MIRGTVPSRIKCTHKVYIKSSIRLTTPRHRMKRPSSVSCKPLCMPYSKPKYSPRKEKKSFVNLNSTDTHEAPNTFAALLKHHRSSTASTIAARDIMAFLTTSTIGDGRVKGTTSDFISYWCDQARLYQQLLGSQSSFSDNKKMIHLVRAVATIPELRSI